MLFSECLLYAVITAPAGCFGHLCQRSEYTNRIVALKSPNKIKQKRNPTDPEAKPQIANAALLAIIVAHYHHSSGTAIYGTRFAPALTLQKQSERAHSGLPRPSENTQFFNQSRLMEKSL